MWNLHPQERLAEWKQFRQSLNNYDFETALEKNSEFWSRVPFVDHYLDRIPPEKWPGPWELLYNNQFCDLSRALGMLYTWQFTDHAQKSNSELRIYYNHCAGERANCFCVNHPEYVLNLEFNTVLKKHSFNRGYELIHTYPAHELIEI